MVVHRDRKPPKVSPFKKQSFLRYPYKVTRDYQRSARVRNKLDEADLYTCINLGEHLGGRPAVGLGRARGHEHLPDRARRSDEAIIYSCCCFCW